MTATTSPRLPRPDAVLVQAAIAGALSFAHLHDIAEAAGQHGWKAWAYPVSVDLLLVVAWQRMRTLRTTGRPTGTAWTWFAIALTASLGANVATAGLLDLAHVPAWLRILVAGWPALAFFGGTLLAHNATTTAAEPEPAEAAPVLHDHLKPATTPPAADPTPPAEAERDDQLDDGPQATGDDKTPPVDRKPVVGTKRTGRRPAASMHELAEIARPAVEQHGPTQAVIRTALREAGIPIASDRLGKLTQRFKDEQATRQADTQASRSAA
ncbi:DUF2637 domain-containing protein [Streptomyces kaniharaensis]|uniref:DUF2637 domain-containing protein n=1 Tax=Streptomyces kaniharaensis TaxID=212423 RepID=A0A6N7KPC2_9ACTN|nr:DUF2637 domain-containing protein [Streptomyces kaniharaensis]MQS13376.1 DUF2637 domain-containing protein [Streptomyces kaniharaensis]